MVAIGISLLWGWILGLFGFKAVIITGMAQVFGVSIDVLGYYFLFAILGLVRVIIAMINNTHSTRKKRKEELSKSWNELKESTKNLKR